MARHSTKSLDGEKIFESVDTGGCIVGNFALKCGNNPNPRCHMELVVRERDDITYVCLAGRFDANGVDQIEEQFSHLLVNRGLPTVVDMSAVTFLSSLGIGFLFANTKKLKKAGCKLVLLKPEKMVESVLRTSKMDKVMPIVSTLDEALHLLGIEPTGRTTKQPSELAATPEQAAVVAPKSVPGLKLAIKNEISELKDLYAKVGVFLDSYSTPYRSGYTVNLALEELVVNVIRYAFMDLDEHLIDISLSIVDQQLILVIEDDGRPFDPQSGNMRPDEYAEDPDDLEVGGLGLVLVLDMVDLLKYTRVNNRNRTEVRIKFYETEEPVETDSI